MSYPPHPPEKNKKVQKRDQQRGSSEPWGQAPSSQVTGAEFNPELRRPSPAPPRCQFPPEVKDPDPPLPARMATLGRDHRRPRPQPHPVTSLRPLHGARPMSTRGVSRLLPGPAQRPVRARESPAPSERPTCRCPTCRPRASGATGGFWPRPRPGCARDPRPPRCSSRCARCTGSPRCSTRCAPATCPGGTRAKSGTCALPFPGPDRPEPGQGAGRGAAVLAQPSRGLPVPQFPRRQVGPRRPGRGAHGPEGDARGAGPGRARGARVGDPAPRVQPGEAGPARCQPTHPPAASTSTLSPRTVLASSPPRPCRLPGETEARCAPLGARGTLHRLSRVRRGGPHREDLGPSHSEEGACTS